MANKKKVVEPNEEIPLTVTEENNTPATEVGKKPDEVVIDGGSTKAPYEVPEVMVNLEPSKKSPTVKVRFGKDYRGNIGGEAYNFKKGDVAVVPENVRRILNKEEGLLRPL